VADSLAGLAVPELARAARIGDMGSGAGFPGLLLALALPHARVDLIESARRKGEVSERLAHAAAIANVTVQAQRVEEWGAGAGGGAYDAVSVRALASLPVIAEYAAPLLRPGGTLVAWKGARDPDEETAARDAAAQLGLEVSRVEESSPFQGARNRHLHVLVKTGPTPAAFPRRPGMARKRPLA